MTGVEGPARALSDVEAAAIIHARFPASRGLRVVRLGEGTDHDAFEVGGRHVFRFPKVDEAADALAAEARLTAWLAPRLPLAIPSYRYVGRSGERFPRSFAGYDKLAGTPALLLDPGGIDLAAAARCVGEFLRALHGLDAGAAEALGLPRDDDPRLEAWSAEALADLRFSHERGYLDAGRAAAWARILAAPPSTAGTPRRVLHGDLAAEHVLLDEQGAPAAVIDWSDAALGDPARDLAGLVHWGGERMLSSALETYGVVDAAALERARWLAACRALADIAFGERRRRREYVAAGLRALAGLEERGPSRPRP